MMKTCFSKICSPFFQLRFLLTVFPLLALLAFPRLQSPVHAQISLSVSTDMVLDTDALVMPDTARFQRSVNGSSFQTEPLVTHKGYQYATWYHAGDNFHENIFLSRRNLNSSTWETVDTGFEMNNGDSGNWDSHNIISMGISGDDKIHLAYDMHANIMRYATTNAGVATTIGGTWNANIFNAERSSLNAGGTSLTGVTYPRFISTGNDMLLTYRAGGSGNGNTIMANYNSTTGNWGNTRTAINGSTGTYSGPFDISNGLDRNAYLNGIDVGPDGSLHMTWTWREDANGPNHDINYAFSENNGLTWKNSAGQSLGTTLSLNSAGIIIQPLDLHQALINQQGQTVDGEGGVHVLMYHRRQEPGYEWQTGDGNFSKADSAYHHYYRDPVTGVWEIKLLPISEKVGSRPKIGFDAANNLFAVYTSPNAGDDHLIIAGAERLASGYADWKILWEDSRDFIGEPLLDQTRLFEHGILSVFLQENTSSVFRDGTPLHVLEYNIAYAVPEPQSLILLTAFSLSLIGRRRRSKVQ